MLLSVQSFTVNTMQEERVRFNFFRGWTCHTVKICGGSSGVRLILSSRDVPPRNYCSTEQDDLD